MIMMQLQLMMLEPVFGIRYINHLHGPGRTMSEKARQKLNKAQQTADEQRIDAKNKVDETNRRKLAADAKKGLNIGQRGGESSKLRTELDGHLAKEVAICEEELKMRERAAEITANMCAWHAIRAQVERRSVQFKMLTNKIKAEETVEIMMAAAEDLPELGLAAWCLAVQGHQESSESDLSLLGTSAAISIFHAGKCWWSCRRHRDIINTCRKIPGLKSSDVKAMRAASSASSASSVVYDADASDSVARRSTQSGTLRMRKGEKAPRVKDFKFFTVPAVFDPSADGLTKEGEAQKWADFEKNKLEPTYTSRKEWDLMLEDLQTKAQKEGNDTVLRIINKELVEREAQKSKIVNEKVEAKAARFQEEQARAADQGEWCAGLVTEASHERVTQLLEAESEGTFLIRRTRDKVNCECRYQPDNPPRLQRVLVCSF